MPSEHGSGLRPGRDEAMPFQTTGVRDGAALREADYEATLATVPALVVTTWPDGRTRFVNRQWSEYTGHDLQSVRRWAANPIVHPHDARRAAAAWRKALRNGEGYDIDYRIRRHDGVYRWHSFRIRPITDAAGQLTGWTSAAVDVDEPHRLQAALEEVNERLQQALTVKEEVLSLVAHELRAPLALIRGNAGLLMRHHSIPEEERELSIRAIASNSDRLQLLVDNMVTLARFDLGRQVELEPLQIARVVERLLEEFRLREPARAFLFSCPDTIEPVLANDVCLTQVVENLLTNAVKYSPLRSSVEVDISVVNGEVSVAVHDRGIGIGGDQGDRLFQPFYRDPAAATTAHGLGLGLTVCRRLVEAQGGKIGAAPRAGGGSSFWFTLPLAESASS
jgi:PAS domain S-box-containing protein